MRGMRALRATSLLAALLTPLIASSAANAAPDAARCASAYENAQRLRPVGKLREARDEALVCADPACPRVLRQDCSVWAGEIQRATPTIVVHAIGTDGCDLVGAPVLVDGARVNDALQGVALPLDPGPHTVRVEPANASAIEQRVVVVEGDHDRRIELRASAAAPVCAAPQVAVVTPIPRALPLAPPGDARPIPTLGYVLGVSGLLELGIGSAVAIAAWSRRGTLEDCRPRCNPDDVDGMRRTFLVSDVLIGVGVASLAAAAYVILTRPSRPSTAPATVGLFRF